MSYAETRAKYLKGVEALGTAITTLGGTFDRWTFSEFDGYAEALFSRFSPFKVGDTVRLTDSFSFTQDDAPGWWSYRTFLKPGAIGSVRDADYYKGWFRFGILFVNQTYADSRTGDVVTIPQSNWSVFTVSERVLELHKE